MNPNETFEISIWAKNSVFIYPLILSLFSALIFWLIFSYAPQRTRQNKIRPLVELDINDIRKVLFSIFDLVMSHAEHSPSYFQSEIKTGKLSEQDINLGLQNKCLNGHYLYNPVVSNKMLVIGVTIGRHANTIDRLVDKVLNFSQYVSSDEIILLERIRENVRRYDFSHEETNKSPATQIGSHVYKPVVPNISYRSSNFYELYLLYIELQRLTTKNPKNPNRNVIINTIQSLYGSCQYKACIAYTRKHLNSLPDDKKLLWNYIALSLYKSGAKKAAYRELYYIYSDRPYNGSLVSSRSLLEPFIYDQKAIEILLLSHTSQELEALKKALEEDAEDRRKFLEFNSLLLKYFKHLKAHPTLHP
jgi:hypothetical protein